MLARPDFNGVILIGLHPLAQFYRPWETVNLIFRQLVSFNNRQLSDN